MFKIAMAVSVDLSIGLFAYLADCSLGADSLSTEAFFGFGVFTAVVCTAVGMCVAAVLVLYKIAVVVFLFARLDLGAADLTVDCGGAVSVVLAAVGGFVSVTVQFSLRHPCQWPFSSLSHSPPKSWEALAALISNPQVSAVDSRWCSLRHPRRCEPVLYR